MVSYLRVVTHPGILANPLSPERAMDNVEALTRLPHVRLLAEEEGFWEIYRGVTGEVNVRGNLVPDAHLAALLRQHGIRTLLYERLGLPKVLLPRRSQPLPGDAVRATTAMTSLRPLARGRYRFSSCTST